MLTENQLRAINLKAQIVSNLCQDKPLNMDMLKEFLLLENNDSEIAQIDSFFELVLDILKSSKNKTFENIDLKAIFNAFDIKEGIGDFYYDFLNFMVNDDPNLELSLRLENLLKINYSIAPNFSNIKRLYLYQVLSLALSCYPLDIELINKLNDELMVLNELNNN